jgi:hypothetical protein
MNEGPGASAPDPSNAMIDCDPDQAGSIRR